MPLPLSVAIPTAAAALAYLNARSSAWHDAKVFKAILKTYWRAWLAERSERLNLFYSLEATATNPATADDLLLVFQGRRYTYAEVYDRVLRHGNWLRSAFGVKQGEVVAVNFINSDDYVFLWWGLWSIGAKPALINYNLSGSPLIHSVNVSGARLCFVDEEVVDKTDQAVRDALPGVSFHVLTPECKANILNTVPARAPDECRVEDQRTNMGMLIYTSGTTGMPKPAVVSWGRCIAIGTCASALLGLTKNDVLFTPMPLYHTSASLMGFCSAVAAGSAIAIGRKFSARGFWDEVREADATAIQYVGETLRYLLATPPQYDPKTGECLDKQHRVRVAMGNGLRPDVWTRFKERFGVDAIFEFYGATEGTFATWNISSNSFAAGAVGRHGWALSALMGVSSAIVPLEESGETPARDAATGFCRRSGPREPGELLFKLPAEDTAKSFQGYYGNKKATQAKILRDVFAKGDAWFRTGDLMRWGDGGLLYFVDRVGDTFRWKSENVSTAEVSAVLGEHPAVTEANVYGVQLPQHDGRAGCAAVFLGDAEGPARDETLRSLAAHVKRTLPTYAQPAFLRILPALGGQMTGTYKLMKKALRDAGVRAGQEGEVEGAGEVYWLRGNTYVPFKDEDWRALDAGQVKL